MFLRYGWAWLFIFCCVAAMAGATHGADESEEEERAELGRRIAQLITKLGDESFEERELASNELANFGLSAKKALTEATKNPDLEIVARAQQLLAKLPKNTHTIVDALGEPIPFAKVKFHLQKRNIGGHMEEVDAAPLSETKTDEFGSVGMPMQVDGAVRVVVVVEHEKYGKGQNEWGPDRTNPQIVFPLVKKGTEAFARALKGFVVDVEGRRVANAVVHCENIRTPGLGLINGKHPVGDAISGEDGTFTVYLPNENEKKERGELIPLNSRYAIRVVVPSDDSLFPLGGSYLNGEPVGLEMARATRKFQFELEDATGSLVEDETQKRQARIQIEQTVDGERTIVPLDETAALRGAKLIEGKYTAQLHLNGKMISYLPLVVTADGPERLRFRLPPSTVYEGRLVHGVTGEPLKEAFVIAYSGLARNNLALLTEGDWNRLREVADRTPSDHADLARLRECYSFGVFARTDSNGKFAITQQPDQEVYGLVAFAEDYVPYKVTVGGLKGKGKDPVAIGELPMFPAAKVVVKPMKEGERLSISPDWAYAEKDLPPWMEKFKAGKKGSEREYEYVHWLVMNEAQPLYIPADLPMKVRFDCPYDDKWTTINIEKEVRLKQGETLDLGELKFVASLPMVAKVVNENGEPIEGAPVRKKLLAHDSWSVVHNTDKEGKAAFYAPPATRGQFRVTDLPGGEEPNKAANLVVEFTAKEGNEKEPVVIRLTKEQVEALKLEKK